MSIRTRKSKIRHFALGAAVAATAACAPAAGARPLDVRSDRAALKAYDAYLAAVVSSESAWTQSSDAFTASIAQQCPNALAAVNALPASSVNKGTLVAFGEELGFNVEIAFVSADLPFAQKLSRTLAHLRWSRAATARAITRWQSATQTLFTMPKSDLCGDANALASSNAQQTPSGTLAWLAQFGRDTSAVSRGAGAFEKVITRFATRGDARYVKSVNRRLAAIQKATKRLGAAAVRKLAAALGLSSTSTS